MNLCQRYLIEGRNMNLYVWTAFAPDYNNGLAFAIAETVEQAQALVIEVRGYEPCDWGPVQVFDLDKPIAFAVSGGG
jgi:hypothetical protein